MDSKMSFQKIKKANNVKKGSSRNMLLRMAASKIDVSSLLAFDLEAKNTLMSLTPKGPNHQRDNFPTI